MFEAGARIFFGGMFGATLVLFQKAKLLLTIAEGNFYAIGSFALVAGFSERLIPELISSLETHLSINKTEQRKGLSGQSSSVKDDA